MEQNQIYCIEGDHLPRLHYNDVNQSKEGKQGVFFRSKLYFPWNCFWISVELPTYEEAIRQYQKQPPQVIVA